jgi:hypothetical protein
VDAWKTTKWVSTVSQEVHIWDLILSTIPQNAHRLIFHIYKQMVRENLTKSHSSKEGSWDINNPALPLPVPEYQALCENT